MPEQSSNTEQITVIPEVPHEYSDGTVEIDDTHIKIFKYYFPLATSKTIMFRDIEKIIVHQKEDIKPIWGTESTNLNNWFPLDSDRKNKQDTYIELVLKGEKSIRPCFSPMDPETCFKVLWFHHSKEGKQLSKHLHQAEKSEDSDKENKKLQNEQMKSKAPTPERSSKSKEKAMRLNERQEPNYDIRLQTASGQSREYKEVEQTNA